VGHKTLNSLGRELQDALRELGLEDARVTESAPPSASPGGEMLVMVDGTTVPVAALARSDFRPVHASELPQLGRHEAGMVFADRIAERTRETLRERGWGWLDRRRGHLRLWYPGLRIDGTIEPRILAEPGPRARNAFTPAGLELALWLLVHPDEEASPRRLARTLGISAGQISNLLAALGANALLRRDKRPLTPELFWALVEQWRPRRHALQAWPPADSLDAPELRVGEWVLSDSAAGVAYGAPLVVGGGHPPDLYVPDDEVLRWVLNRSPLAVEYAQRAATVAVAPTPLVNDERLRVAAPGTVVGWTGALAHPVVVALDLATDRARGREVVSNWDPDPALGVTRVW
jgi:hypothetical protein